MIRIFKLVLLLVVSQVAFGQAPSNYTNINGRYRWIAGMFDSTFHIPKGTTPSLRTGGSTNSGGLFYNTSDSSVYTYTGTQWIKVRGSLNPSDTTNKYVTQVYKKNGSDSVFYVKGGNHLWAFNDSTGNAGGGGGGKIYYFNGGVNMGTIGGLQMYELGDTANTGTAANFTRNTAGGLANFITDPGKPGLLQIPAGVWTVDAWLSETGGGSNSAQIWIEVEKWDGTTITTIATSPIEEITEGSTPNLYTWSVSIPTTTLAVTDRIVVQFYITNTNGKTVTLYTQNGYVGEIHTTFTTGIGALNGLTAPAQYLVTGTAGTDFNINSVTATHTFNLPTASATNRGALSSADWTTFNNKLNISDTASMLSPYLRKVDTASLSNRINLKLNISDTATMLNNYVNNVGYGLSKVGKVVSADSATLASYFLRRKDSLTSTNLLGYVTRKILADSTAAVRAASGTGTVTSVGSNTGTGLTGGPITTSGTLAIDTITISTRRWRQKGIDSVQSNLTSGLALKVNISDTASMLSPYLRSNVAAATYVPQTRTITINGTSQDLSANRTFSVGTVTSVGITAGTGISVANSPVTGSGNITVTNTAPDQTVALTAGTGITIGGTYPSFTITNSSPSSGGTVTSVATNNGTGITGGTITGAGTLAIDTVVISTRAWRQKGIDSVQGNLTAGLALKLNISDTANMLLPYLRKVDTASLSNRINLKVNISDTASMLNPYLRKVDTASLSNRINLKLNISDTASMLSPYLRKIDTASLSNRINLKVNISDTANMLNPYLRKVDTASLSNRINTKLNISDTATMLGNYVNNVGYGLSKVSQVVSADSATLASYFLRRKDSLTATNLLGYVTGKILADTAAAVRAAAGGGSIGGSGTINRLAKFTASGTIGNSSIADSSSSVAMTISSGGNVGIGNTNPSTKLDITGQLKATGTDNHILQVADGSAQLKLERTSTSTGAMFLGADNLGLRIFDASLNSRMLITPAGNIGFNTTTPSVYSNYTTLTINNTSGSEIDFLVNGTLTADIFANVNGFYLSTRTATPLFFSTNGTEKARITSAGALFLGNGETASSPSTGIISGTGGTGTNVAGAEFRIRGGASTGSGAGGPITFYTAAAGASGTTVRAATERMRLDASGNLGLGVTPSAWGGIFQAMQIGTGGSIFGRTSSNQDVFQMGANVFYDGSNWKYIANGFSTRYEQVNGQHVWHTAPSGTAGNTISFTQAMTLNASGNLSIGNTNNTYKLDVSGNVLFKPAAGYNVLFQNSGTTLRMNYLNDAGSANISATYRATDFGWQDGSGNGVLTLNSSGNLGIGTSAPTFKLDVQGGSIVNGNGTIQTALTYATMGIVGTLSNHALALYTNNTEKVRITTGGLVGIGTTSPSGRLHIDPADNEIGLNVSTSSLTGANAQSLVDLAQTWNTTGNPTAIKLNITNTASGTGADLMELQVGGTNQFRVTKGGAIETDNPTTGTKKPWKLGSVMASSMAYDATRYVEVEIDGTLYYLALSTLAEPAPSPEDRQASGPSYSVQKDRPIIKPETDKIKSLEKEIAELKQLIKSIQK